MSRLNVMSSQENSKTPINYDESHDSASSCHIRPVNSGTVKYYLGKQPVESCLLPNADREGLDNLT